MSTTAAKTAAAKEAAAAKTAAAKKAAATKAAATKKAAAAKAAAANRDKVKNPYIALYQLALAEGKFERVENLLRPYLAEEPLDATCLTLLATARLRLNDPAEAAKLFGEAEAIAGYDLARRRNWAEALDGAGQGDSARALLLAAIDREPSVWQLWWDYAALVEKPEHHEALAQRWRNQLATKKLSDAIERAVAKSATLVDDFETAYSIYRRLIAVQTQTLTAQVAKNGIDHPIAKVVKVKSNDLGGGKGETCLKDFKSALEAGDVPFFLMAGTVLGYIRDGQLLVGDKDVDCGVFEKDWDRPAIEGLLRDSGNFQIKRVDDHADRIRAIHRNGVWIDVFPYFKEGDRQWHAGTVARWWHPEFELMPYEVDGTEFMIPADTENYLEWNYGPEWRVPYSLFDVYTDAPNVEVVRPDFLRYSRWRKMFEGLKVRDWEKVLKYLDKDVEVLTENPWLERLRIIANRQRRLDEAEEQELAAAAAAAGAASAANGAQ